MPMIDFVSVFVDGASISSAVGVVVTATFYLRPRLQLNDLPPDTGHSITDGSRRLSGGTRPRTDNSVAGETA